MTVIAYCAKTHTLAADKRCSLGTSYTVTKKIFEINGGTSEPPIFIAHTGSSFGSVALHDWYQQGADKKTQYQ